MIFKKIAISKKGIGIESQKITQTSKQLKNHRNKVELNGFYRTKINCKAFAILILTASAFKNLAVRTGIANTLQLTFVLYQQLSSILFLWFFVCYLVCIVILIVRLSIPIPVFEIACIYGLYSVCAL